MTHLANFRPGIHRVSDMMGKVYLVLSVCHIMMCVCNHPTPSTICLSYLTKHYRIWSRPGPVLSDLALYHRSWSYMFISRLLLSRLIPYHHPWRTGARVFHVETVPMPEWITKPELCEKGERTFFDGEWYFVADQDGNERGPYRYTLIYAIR